MSDSIQIRVLKNVGGFKKDQVVRTPCDERGNPIDLFWIRRLKEAERDQCCEIVPKITKTETPTAEASIKRTRKRRENTRSESQ